MAWTFQKLTNPSKALQHSQKVAMIRLKDYIYLALPETYITKETKMTSVIVQTTKGRLIKRYDSYEPITSVYEIK